MLTTTYSLVALSIEQTSTRMDLSLLLKYMQRRMSPQQIISRDDLYSLLHKLNQFQTYSTVRKVERCLIPALRHCTKKSDFLLAELESLGSLALNVLRVIQEKFRMALEQGALAMGEIFSEIELYCAVSFQKIEKEEQELFPMAERFLSQEVWFSMAVQFLSHDAKYAVKCPVAEPSAPPILPVKFLSYQVAPQTISLGIPGRSIMRPMHEKRYIPALPTLVLPEFFQPPREAVAH